jgi:acyl transferase domain-containing protein
MRILIAAMIVALALGAGGCTEQMAVPDQPSGLGPTVSGPPVEPQPVDYLPSTAVRGEQEETDTVISEALESQKKLTLAMEKLLQQQRINRQLTEENRTLAEEMIKLKKDLAAAQKELADANEMLLMMREDLNKWKANVLGFREEMQQAMLAVLKSQQRILALLGAEGAAVSMSPEGSSE